MEFIAAICLETLNGNHGLQFVYKPINLCTYMWKFRCTKNREDSYIFEIINYNNRTKVYEMEKIHMKESISIPTNWKLPVT